MSQHVLPLSSLATAGGIKLLAAAEVWDIDHVLWHQEALRCTVPGCNRRIWWCFFVTRSEGGIFGPIGSVCGPKLVELSHATTFWEEVKMTGRKPEDVATEEWEAAILRYQSKLLVEKPPALARKVLIEYCDAKIIEKKAKIWRQLREAIAVGGRLSPKQLTFLGDCMTSEPLVDVLSNIEKRLVGEQVDDAPVTAECDRLIERCTKLLAIKLTKRDQLMVAGFKRDLKKYGSLFPWKVAKIDALAKRCKID